MLLHIFKNKPKQNIPKQIFHHEKQEQKQKQTKQTNKQTNKKKTVTHTHKQRKNKKEATDITADSSSEFSEETRASSTRKKSPKNSLTLGGESDTSQSGDSTTSSSEETEKRDTKKTKRKKKEKSTHIPVPDPEVEERTSNRRNWKVATDGHQVC